MARTKARDLLLLRHAKSSWDAPLLEDFARPLAKRGRKAARHIARWLADHDVRPALVLCSPATRTRETLEFIKPVLGDPQITYEKALYLADAGDLLDRIREIGDEVRSVLVIGHNPGLQDLALALAPSRARKQRAHLAEKFPTAAMIWFRINGPWSELKPGSGEIAAYIRPADLAP